MQYIIVILNDFDILDDFIGLFLQIKIICVLETEKWIKYPKLKLKFIKNSFLYK
jgi:hypothetical protein